MKIKDLKIGYWFKIINEDNAIKTITFGKITDIYKMRAGEDYGIQFNDELQTFTWNLLENELPKGFIFIGEEEGL